MRHPGDLFRVLLGSIALAGSAVVVLGGQVGRFEANLFRLVNDLPAALALPLMGIMQAGAFPAVPVVAGLAYIARRSRLAWDLAAAGTLAYGLARLIKLLILRERPGAYLEQVVIRGAEAIGLGYPSGHVAVASALATAAGPYLSLWTRRVAWIVVALVAVARIYVGAHLPVDVLGGAALGWTIGAAWHLVWGAPRSAPAPELIVAALQRAQVDPIDLRPLRVDARGSTPYVVQTAGGTELFVKSVGREQRTADVLFKAWRWLLFREVEDEAPFATPKQQIEHEAYIALLAERTGVCTPRIVCATALSDGSALLAQARGSGAGSIPCRRMRSTVRSSGGSGSKWPCCAARASPIVTCAARIS
jgi:undecaprenyl-diphosphatase